MDWAVEVVEVDTVVEVVIVVEVIRVFRMIWVIRVVKVVCKYEEKLGCKRSPKNNNNTPNI